MSNRDHHLDAAKLPAGELAQERSPERLGFARADVHAEHAAASILGKEKDDKSLPSRRLR